MSERIRLMFWRVPHFPTTQITDNSAFSPSNLPTRSPNSVSNNFQTTRFHEARERPSEFPSRSVNAPKPHLNRSNAGNESPNSPTTNTLPHRPLSLSLSLSLPLYLSLTLSQYPNTRHLPRLNLPPNKNPTHSPSHQTTTNDRSYQRTHNATSSLRRPTPTNQNGNLDLSNPAHRFDLVTARAGEMWRC